MPFIIRTACWPGVVLAQGNSTAARNRVEREGRPNVVSRVVMLSSDQNEDLNLACTILCLYQKRHKISAPGLRCRGLEENSDSICILLGS